MTGENSALLTVTARTATIMLNRPDAQNALDEAMIGELQVVLDKVAAMQDVSAVVLRGKGRGFSAGTDPGWLKRSLTYDETRNREDARRLGDMLHRLDTMPQTTIALVHGAAMGSGMGLLCCCDVVFADQTAIFAMTETRVGLAPASVGPYVMAAIGPRQARRFFQTGERISAERALAIGLVHELVGKAEDLERRCDDLLVALGENGPLAMKAAKQLYRDLSGDTNEETRRAAMAGRIAALRSTPEAREGIQATLDRRRPSWQKTNG